MPESIKQQMSGKKIGRRSKALRMLMNVSPLTRSARRHGDTRISNLFWNKPWELLPKVFCLSSSLFVCFSVFWAFLWVLFLLWFGFWGGVGFCFIRLKAVIGVRAAQGGGQGIFA